MPVALVADVAKYIAWSFGGRIRPKGAPKSNTLSKKQRHIVLRAILQNRGQPTDYLLPAACSK
jgi:hypothetical protein